MLTFGSVICTYKRTKILEQCLTFWNQSEYQPDQFIVVDATENAEEYRQSLIEKFPLLFSKPNSQYIITNQPGLTHQRNLGLQKTKTDIVCFTDDDTFVSPDYVTKIIEVFQQDKLHVIGGVNGSASGQFDRKSQKYFRLARNYIRHHFGWFIQRINIPKDQTQLFKPLPSELQSLQLIHIDRLWGANMNYRRELLDSSGFDENFKLYGLFEDVEMSVRLGRTHKLVCRLDATVVHDDSLGESTRPNDARYFLASWLNSAYIIEKLFPCEVSRNSFQRLFQLTKLISQTVPRKVREKKIKKLGNEILFRTAQRYITDLRSCQDRVSLQETFVQIQNEIYTLKL